MEIEDWNEYGELKQHVKIYYDAHTTPAKGTPTPTPNITPAKKTASKAATATSSESSSKPSESTKSEPETKAEVKKNVEEPEKAAPTGGLPTAFTIAMKQAGEEAAKKAKEGKKKVVQVFDGTGEATPKTAAKAEKEVPETEAKDVSSSKSATEPTYGLAALMITDHPIHHSVASMQSPTSTAWKTPQIPTSKFSAAGPMNIESLQSPNSTAWKPTTFEPPVTHHRGSEVEEASAEEIRAIEKAQAIKEEDEDDESDEEAIQD